MFGFFSAPSSAPAPSSASVPALEVLIPEVPAPEVPVPVPEVSTKKTWSETFWECGTTVGSYIGPIVIEALKEQLKNSGKEKLTAVTDKLFDEGVAEALELAKLEATNITKEAAGKVVKTVKEDATKALTKQITKQLTN